MVRRPYIGPAASQERRDWRWCVFNNDGQFVCRGKTRIEAIHRAERAEGRGHHGPLLIVKHERSGEKWVRLRGAWFRSLEQTA
jgi:hypothetical protein